MTRGVRLTVKNAPRRCGLCGSSATAYLHAVGFRCGDCHDDAPARKAAAGQGGPIA